MLGTISAPSKDDLGISCINNRNQQIITKESSRDSSTSKETTVPLYLKHKELYIHTTTTDRSTSFPVETFSVAGALPASAVKHILAFHQGRVFLKFRLLSKGFNEIVKDHVWHWTRLLHKSKLQGLYTTVSNSYTPATFAGDVKEQAYQGVHSSPAQIKIDEKGESETSQIEDTVEVLFPSIADFVLGVTFESLAWKQRLIRGEIVYTLPDKLQDNGNWAIVSEASNVHRAGSRLMNKPANSRTCNMMDLMMTRSKLVTLARHSKRASGPIKKSHVLTFPVVMEERPRRQRRIMVMWPDTRNQIASPPISRLTCAFNFKAVLSGLSTAASAPISLRSPEVCLPEVSWIAQVVREGCTIYDVSSTGFSDEHCLLLNWSSVWMADVDDPSILRVRCRISGHMIREWVGSIEHSDQQQSVLEPRLSASPNFILNFPITQKSLARGSPTADIVGCCVTAMSALSLRDSVADSPRCLIVVGTLAGEVHLGLTQPLRAPSLYEPLEHSVYVTKSEEPNTIIEIALYYHDKESRQTESFSILVFWASPPTCEIRRSFIPQKCTFAELQVTQLLWEPIFHLDTLSLDRHCTFSLKWAPTTDQVCFFIKAIDAANFLQLPELSRTEFSSEQNETSVACHEREFMHRQVGDASVSIAVNAVVPSSRANQINSGTLGDVAPVPPKYGRHSPDLLTYRVTGRPTFVDYISAFDYWIIAVRKCLRIVRLEDNENDKKGREIRVKSVLIGHNHSIYCGRDDNYYRYCSIDTSELLIIWDLRSFTKLMHLHLVDLFYDFTGLHSISNLGAHASSIDSLFNDSDSSKNRAKHESIGFLEVDDSLKGETPMNDIKIPADPTDPHYSDDDAFPRLESLRDNTDHRFFAEATSKWKSGIEEVKKRADTVLRENSQGDLVASEIQLSGSFNCEMSSLARKCGLTLEEFAQYQEALFDDEVLQRVLRESKRIHDKTEDGVLEKESQSEESTSQTVAKSTIISKELSTGLLKQLAAADGFTLREWLPRQQASLPSTNVDIEQSSCLSDKTSGSVKMMISLLARKIFGFPVPEHVTADLTPDDHEESDADYGIIQNACRQLDYSAQGADKRTRRRLVREFERMFQKPRGPSDTARATWKVGNKRAIGEVVFTESQLALYFPSLSSWQVWDF